MRLLIIGAGWYGSHIAKKCIEAGHTVTIIDKQNDFFCGSSYKNQNRLHLGFHYPRSDDTIHECVAGFSKFKTEYPQLSRPIRMNLYFLVKDASKISFQDFQSVFSQKNIPFDILSTDAIFPSLKNVEEFSIKVDEEYIDFQNVKSYFQGLLGKHLFRIEDTSVFKNIDSILLKRRHKLRNLNMKMNLIAIFNKSLNNNKKIKTNPNKKLKNSLIMINS